MRESKESHPRTTGRFNPDQIRFSLPRNRKLKIDCGVFGWEELDLQWCDKDQPKVHKIKGARHIMIYHTEPQEWFMTVEVVQ